MRHEQGRVDLFEAIEKTRKQSNVNNYLHQIKAEKVSAREMPFFRENEENLNFILILLKICVIIYKTIACAYYFM